MPRTRIIRVNSVSDIDLSRVSVYDMSNRYVDSSGKMYGLRYNRAEKTIEIIKIIRTPAKSAGYFGKKVQEFRKSRAAGNGEELPAGEDHSLPEGDNAVSGEEAGSVGGIAAPGEDTEASLVFDPDAFLNATLEKMKSHRDRINGIMMNVKNSNVIKESDRGESAFLIDLFRNLDIDGVQRIDKLLSEHRELMSYPRSLVYYIAKLDTRSRNIVDSLTGDTVKMRFIFLVEMFFSIRNLYRTLQKILNELSEFLRSKTPDDTRGLSHNEVKVLEDGKISVENTLAETMEVLEGCSRLEHHIFREKKL